MKNYTEIKPTETIVEFMKGLTATGNIYTTGREGACLDRIPTEYKDAEGRIWYVGTDRDGWLYKYEAN